MKTFKQFMGTLLLTLGLLAHVQAQDPFTNGLQAYYRLEGDATDASGNGRDGTAFNGVSYVPDFSGIVASFNGSSQYISLPLLLTTVFQSVLLLPPKEQAIYTVK